MAATLTGHGGVGEIGGNAFVLDDGRSRVFLDFGKRFGNDKAVEKRGAVPGWGDYFDEFLQPRTFNLVPDLLSLDLIPDIRGIYRSDLGGDAAVPDVAGVLVSHAHMDHCGLIGLLRPDIPVLASTESKATMQSVQETGMGGAEMDMVHTKARGNLGRTKNGKITNRPKFNPGPERAFDLEPTTDLGEWDVRQFPVDHSIHGARGAVLTGKDVSVAYTGDFRLHGRHGDRSQKYVERIGDVDVLVMEGTRVRRASDDGQEPPDSDKEVEVEDEIAALVEAEDKRTGPGFVGVSYPPRDLDRLVSIHNVARRVGRTLAISTKQAHLLQTLRGAGRDDLPDPRQDPHIAVHLPARMVGSIRHPLGAPVPVARDDLRLEAVDLEPGEQLALIEKDYATWERDYLGWDNAVTSYEIGKDPSAYLMSISYWSITQLIDVFGGRPDKRAGLYIHSQTQPFNDDMLQNERKLQRWLKVFNLGYAETHVSGHVAEEDIHWILDEVRPRVLVPVHSEFPGITADRYQERTGQKALLPEPGQSLDLA